MDIEKIIDSLEEESKKAYEYALNCKTNSVQEYWFGQANGFKKSIILIRNKININK